MHLRSPFRCRPCLLLAPSSQVLKDLNASDVEQLALEEDARLLAYVQGMTHLVQLLLAGCQLAHVRMQLT